MMTLIVCLNEWTLTLIANWVLCLIAFFSVYDIFSSINDANLLHREDLPTRRVYPLKIDGSFILGKTIVAIISMVAISVLLYLLNELRTTVSLLIYMGVLSIVFLTHDCISTKWRTITYLLLYALKPILLLIPVLDNSLSYSKISFCAAVLFSISNWPQYAIRRAGYKWLFQGVLRVFRISFVYKICTLLLLALLIRRNYAPMILFAVISLTQAAVNRALGKNILSYGH
jgi:hypothetical protein